MRHLDFAQIRLKSFRVAAPYGFYHRNLAASGSG